MKAGRQVSEWALQDFTDAQRAELLDSLITLNPRSARTPRGPGRPAIPED